MEKSFFLAFDLGAESGRTILGLREHGQTLTRELSRFPNAPVQVLGHLHWNIYSLFEEIKKGMMAGLAEARTQPVSLAVDTWGVDFGLLSLDGTVLGLPYAYRDAGPQRGMEELLGRRPRTPRPSNPGRGPSAPFRARGSAPAHAEDRFPRHSTRGPEPLGFPRNRAQEDSGHCHGQPRYRSRHRRRARVRRGLGLYQFGDMGPDGSGAGLAPDQPHCPFRQF